MARERAQEKHEAHDAQPRQIQRAFDEFRALRAHGRTGGCGTGGTSDAASGVFALTLPPIALRFLCRTAGHAAADAVVGPRDPVDVFLV